MMVGGRSLGCQTCKTRRIKCDQRHPTCRQCEKSGRHCPGPLTPFIYESEIAKAENEATLQNTVVPLRIRWKPVVAAPATAKPPVASPRARSRSPEPPVTEPIVRPLTDPSQRLATTIVRLLQVTAGTGKDVIVIAEYLPFLPKRIGHNAALDAGVEAMLFSYQRMVDGQDYDGSKHMSAYVKALQQLKTQIDNEQSNVPPETLCTALALCTDELFFQSNDPDYATFHHVNGAAALFQAWGPERFKDRFEKVLLQSQTYQIIGWALVNAIPCFFEQPGWKTLFEEEFEYFGPWDRLNAKITAIYATLPCLLADISNESSSPTFLAESAYSDDLLHRAQAFRARLLHLEPNIEELLTGYGIVDEVPSSHPGSPYETCYLFKNILVIQPLLMYWRLIIIINHLILQLSNPPPKTVSELETSSLYAAHNIGMSIETGRKWKPCGYWLVAFSLPAAAWAYAHCAGLRKEHEYEKEALWIQTLLYKFVSSMETGYIAIFKRYWTVLGMDYPSLGVFNNPEDRGLPRPSVGSVDSDNATGLS